MTHDFKKLSEIQDEYRILLTGQQDESKFGRVFNSALKNTHQLDFREEVMSDGEVKRKGLVIWMRPLELAEIRARSDDFKTLSMLELRELVKRYGLTLPTITGTGYDEREEAVKALTAYRPAAPAATTPAPKAALIIPKDILDLPKPDLLTRCAVEGVGTKKNGRDLPVEVLQQALARKLAEKEAK